MLNKSLFNFVYFLYKIPTLIPFLYTSKFNLQTKSISDGNNILFFNHFNRLYLYSRSLSYRYNKLLSEYCIYPDMELKIENGDYIIDCGANIGEFSLPFSLQFGVKKFIYFEPDTS